MGDLIQQQWDQARKRFEDGERVTHPEKCPTCDGTGMERVGFGRGRGKPVEWREVECHACHGSAKLTLYYFRKYRLAIVDALNVLGAPMTHENECEGCEYERHEAMSILYESLGMYLNFKEPLLSYLEFQQERDAVVRRDG